MIRIDTIWLSTEPMDMRAGTDTAMARVVSVFGAAQPHCAYLFANRRGTRMKVLAHDGLGIWLAARRLHQGKFIWPGTRHGTQVELSTEHRAATGPDSGFALVKSRPRKRYFHSLIYAQCNCPISLLSRLR